MILKAETVETDYIKTMFLARLTPAGLTNVPSSSFSPQRNQAECCGCDLSRGKSDHLGKFATLDIVTGLPGALDGSVLCCVQQLSAVRAARPAAWGARASE